MNVILLSGGSGKRLWPLSNDVRSKQFLKILSHNNEHKSMIQIAYDKIKNIDKNSKIVIATSNTQEEIIKSQLNEDVNLSIEPARRDTFPAIALACYYLKDMLLLSLDEPVIVCPVDSAVDDEFFENLKTMSDFVAESKSKLILTGIVPSYPSENYGYIIPESKDNFTKVLEFKEKPNKETAAKYIENGALWNSGVFGFKLGYLTDVTKKVTGFSSYSDLLMNYETLIKISFDYAVCEKEKDISVCRFDGLWSDIGTWDTLSANIVEDEIGHNIYSTNCNNTTIINETSLPILANKMNDCIVVASYDGILVSDKQSSSNIKTTAKSLQNTNNVNEYSWGIESLIYRDNKSMTFVTTIWKDKNLCVASNAASVEVIAIVSGHGTLKIDDETINVDPGYSFKTKSNQGWNLYADKQLELRRVCIF